VQAGNEKTTRKDTKNKYLDYDKVLQKKKIQKKATSKINQNITRKKKDRKDKNLAK